MLQMMIICFCWIDGVVSLFSRHFCLNYLFKNLTEKRMINLTS